MSDKDRRLRLLFGEDDGPDPSDADQEGPRVDEECHLILNGASTVSYDTGDMILGEGASGQVLINTGEDPQWTTIATNPPEQTSMPTRLALPGAPPSISVIGYVATVDIALSVDQGSLPEISFERDQISISCEILDPRAFLARIRQEPNFVMERLIEGGYYEMREGTVIFPRDMNISRGVDSDTAVANLSYVIVEGTDG